MLTCTRSSERSVRTAILFPWCIITVPRISNNIEIAHLFSSTNLIIDYVKIFTSYFHHIAYLPSPEITMIVFVTKVPANLPIINLMFLKFLQYRCVAMPETTWIPNNRGAGPRFISHGSKFKSVFSYNSSIIRKS